VNPSLIHCPAADYHADKTAVSASALKLFDRAPSLFLDWQQGRDAKGDPSPSLRLGSLVHTLTLEPERFADSWCVVPHDAPRKPSITQREAAKPSPATVAAIEFWDSWEAALNGRTAINAEEYEEAETIAEKCFGNKAIGQILRARGEVEAVVKWTDADTGIMCKARMDKALLTQTGKVVFDLKTCADASLDGFQRAAVGYGYHIQVAHYLAAAEALAGEAATFFFGCVETSKPHLTHCFSAGSDFIAYGQRERRRLLASLAKCFETGSFPGLCATDFGVSELTLPRWINP
jgi:exodeoxyribonuclease VIII